MRAPQRVGDVALEDESLNRIKTERCEQQLPFASSQGPEAKISVPIESAKNLAFAAEFHDMAHARWHVFQKQHRQRFRAQGIPMHAR